MRAWIGTAGIRPDDVDAHGDTTFQRCFRITVTEDTASRQHSKFSHDVCPTQPSSIFLLAPRLPIGTFPEALSLPRNGWTRNWLSSS